MMTWTRVRNDMATAERDAAAMACDAARLPCQRLMPPAEEAARTLEAAQSALTAAETAQMAAESARDEARMGEADAERPAMAVEAAATQATADAKAATDAAAQAAVDLKDARDSLAAATLARMDAEMERDGAQEMLDMNITPEVATRADTLHGALNIINHAGHDNSSPLAGGFADVGDDMPGSVRVADGAPKAVGGLGLTHRVATGTAVRAIDSVGLALTGYTAADGMAAAIEGWDGLVLSRGTAADDATQTLYAYGDIAGAPG